MITLPTVQSTEPTAKLFRGLADPARLGILEQLRSGPCSVSEIVEGTKLSQPNVSNHLSCLRECGLVIGERQGRFVYYRLSDPRIDALLEQAGTIVADVAHGLSACTRYGEEEEPVG